MKSPNIITKAQLKITFDDAKKIIIIETPSGNSISLNENDKKIEIKDSSGNVVLMNHDGISLHSVRDIRISGQNIILEAVNKLESRALSIEQTAQTNFSGKGNASAELSSGGITTIKGSLVNIN